MGRKGFNFKTFSNTLNYIIVLMKNVASYWLGIFFSIFASLINWFR
jgi:hypothetical protein